jgi:two-component system chemotaxis response regulator CheB
MAAYDLIAVGASWGGLEALERVLCALPARFGVPIVIVQHRSVDSGSGAISAILARHSGRDVREPGDKDPIEAGRIYVAPADYHMLVEPGSLALSTDAHVQHSRPSIDVLFDSAADAYGERLIAVLLTGLNVDGAYGITRVRRRGGYTIAQDPDTAARAEMPQAAIDTGDVNRVADLDEIAPLLVQLVSEERGGRRGQAA